MNRLLRGALVVALACALFVWADAPLRAGDASTDQSASPSAEELIRALTPAPETAAAPVRTRGFSVKKAGDEPQAVVSQARPSVALHVEFAYDSSELAPGAAAVLEELGKALSSKALGDYRFRIIGHTDAAGPEEYNLALSLRRARTVAGYLMDRFGIVPERMDVLGHGEERLLPGLDPRDGRNRRVEVVNIGQ